MERPQGLHLRDHWAILRRRFGWVLLFVVVTVAGAMTVTYRQTPVYQSSAKVLIEPLGSASQQSALERALVGQANLTTQRQVVTSVAVAERVIEQLELAVPPRPLLTRIGVDVIGDSSVMEIRADHPDPQMAAALAQGFSEVYLDFRRERATEQLGTATADLSSQADQLRDRIADIDAELARLDTTAPDTQTEPTPGTSVRREAALERERDTLLTQLGQITGQLSTLTATSQVGNGGEIIVPAAVPDQPVSPDPMRNGVLALVLGTVLGLAVAFAVDQLDDAIRSDEEVQRALGKPIVGRIPHWKGARKADQPVTIDDPWSPSAEAYRTLRTNVRFLARPQSGDDPGRGASIVVTSTTSQEGKTTTAVNLAVAAARAGTRTLLVDADLRHPAVHVQFGISQTGGFADLLVDAVDLRDAVTDVGIPNLRVIPCGHVPPNPSELLASANTRRHLSGFEELAELVVIDSAPVLAVADTLELAPAVTSVLLVVEAGRSHRRALRAAGERLAGVGTEAAGVVMNNIEPGTSYYGYSYGSFERYEPDTDAGPPAPYARGDGDRARPERTPPTDEAASPPSTVSTSPEASSPSPGPPTSRPPRSFSRSQPPNTSADH